MLLWLGQESSTFFVPNPLPLILLLFHTISPSNIWLSQIDFYSPLIGFNTEQDIFKWCCWSLVLLSDEFPTSHQINLLLLPFPLSSVSWSRRYLSQRETAAHRQARALRCTPSLSSIPKLLVSSTVMSLSSPSMSHQSNTVYWMGGWVTGDGPLVTVPWWFSFGGYFLLVCLWCLSFGACSLVAVQWWLSFRGYPLVLVLWRLTVFGHAVTRGRHYKHYSDNTMIHF